jgi:hypothetical protein
MTERVVGFLEALDRKKGSIWVIFIQMLPAVNDWNVDHPELLSAGYRWTNDWNYKNTDGQQFDRHSGWEKALPVLGLPNPVLAKQLARMLQEDKPAGSRLVGFLRRSSVIKSELALCADKTTEYNWTMQVSEFASPGQWGADDLLDIWIALWNLEWFAGFDFGLSSLVSHGALDHRPLVPVQKISLIKRLLPSVHFQAKGEEQANNVINSTMRMFEGYGTRLLVQRVYEWLFRNWRRRKSGKKFSDGKNAEAAIDGCPQKSFSCSAALWGLLIMLWAIRHWCCAIEILSWAEISFGSNKWDRRNYAYCTKWNKSPAKRILKSSRIPLFKSYFCPNMRQ